MVAGADLVAFVASRDLEVSGRFYGGVLGLELVESSAFANAYVVSGTRLRVTLVDELVAAPYTVLGWQVPAIEEAVAGLVALGVELRRYDGMGQDRHGIWTAPSGTRVAWFADPDGNVLSLQQEP